MDANTKRSTFLERNISFIFLAAFLFFVGFLMTTLGFTSVYNRYQVDRIAKLTDAQIVRISSIEQQKGTKYNVFVEYRVQGRNFTNKHLGYYFDGMKEGDTVTIRYNPRNPAQILSPESNYITLLIFPIIGCGFVFYGFFQIRYYYRLYSLGVRLRKEGRNLIGEVSKCEIAPNSTSRKNQPYRLYCTTQEEPYQDRYFIWEEFFTFAPQDVVDASVTIYVDTNDPDIYYVDCDTLSKPGTDLTGINVTFK